jgi:hypothetical protein
MLFSIFAFSGVLSLAFKEILKFAFVGGDIGIQICHSALTKINRIEHLA